MIIREYVSSDCKEMSELFYQTVHMINAKDYTKEQLDIWAPDKIDLEKWNQSFQKHYSLVAIENDTIIGFGDIDKTGYLDRLYVHAYHQGKGVASAICDKLEQTVHGKVFSHVSVTAKPFFEKRGYRIIMEQKIERCGVFLINYIMEKEKQNTICYNM